MTQKTRAKFEALWASYMEARDALAASSAPDLPATSDGFARFVMEAEGDRALKSHLGLVNEARKALRRLVKHVHKHGQTVMADQAAAGSEASAPARKAEPARSAPRKRRVTSLEPSVRTPVGPRGRKAAPPAAAPAAAKAARPAGGRAKTAATPRPRRSPAAKTAEPAPAKQPNEGKGPKSAGKSAAKRPARAPAARALSRRPGKATTKTP